MAMARSFLERRRRRCCMIQRRRRSASCECWRKEKFALWTEPTFRFGPKPSASMAIPRARSNSRGHCGPDWKAKELPSPHQKKA